MDEFSASTDVLVRTDFAFSGFVHLRFVSCNNLSIRFAEGMSEISSARFIRLLRSAVDYVLQPSN